MSHEESLVTGYLPGYLSGLACAGANRPVEGRENGILTAQEVAWLDLGGCELVVLSACQTGLGASRSGEGMMSLRRSFEQAGARAVISSLWRVRDDSTRELMVRFYERRWSGEGNLAALRGAQLERLARNREKHGEGLPATWGAFVLSGEWE
jgi:CHAT domain-containing protein